MDTTDKQEAERINEVQIAYLIQFRRALEAGALSIREALRRAAMYAGIITTVYWLTHTRAIGLPQLPAMPGVRTSCLSNCLCSWRITELAGNGNWDCDWMLQPADHCPQCLRRNQVFSPLRIRRGIIQPFNPIGLYT
jgi:hypothetical protein